MTVPIESGEICLSLCRNDVCNTRLVAIGIAIELLATLSLAS